MRPWYYVMRASEALRNTHGAGRPGNEASANLNIYSLVYGCSSGGGADFSFPVSCLFFSKAARNNSAY